MTDIIIVISLLALFALGTLPVMKLGEFMQTRRRYIKEPRRSAAQRVCSGKPGPAERFDRTGVLYLDDEEDESAEDEKAPASWSKPK